MHDKGEYSIHIRNLKEALNHGLFLKKVHGITKFNKIDWLKLCIDMCKDLRNKVNKAKFINNAVFRKIIENVRKHRYINLVTTEKRRNYLVGKPNYHISRFFSENIFAIEMRKTLMILTE